MKNAGTACFGRLSGVFVFGGTFQVSFGVVFFFLFGSTSSRVAYTQEVVVLYQGCRVFSVRDGGVEGLVRGGGVQQLTGVALLIRFVWTVLFRERMCFREGLRTPSEQQHKAVLATSLWLLRGGLEFRATFGCIGGRLAFRTAFSRFCTCDAGCLCKNLCFGGFYFGGIWGSDVFAAKMFVCCSFVGRDFIGGAEYFPQTWIAFSVGDED